MAILYSYFDGKSAIESAGLGPLRVRRMEHTAGDTGWRRSKSS